MKKPFVSVILCVYNPKKEELHEAVMSIIFQSMEEWELLLYDDGSDKEQEKIIYDTSCMDKRIRYFRSNRHHGLAYGLNKLIECTSGTYIARMDGDDVSHPGRLEKQCVFLENHPDYAWVGCNVKLIDEQGKTWGKRQMPEVPHKSDFLKYSPYVHPSAVFRADVLKKNPYKSTEALRGEDYELFMRLHAKGWQGCNLQEELLSYRETAAAYRRRRFCCQIQEIRIRYRGFHMLQIKSPRKLFYIVKPVIVWMLPARLLFQIKRKST